jgi:hypothetical protein
LVLAGILIGPYVLDIFGKERPVADFMADLGKLLLMFYAGLEVDLALFRQSQRKVTIFGLLTTTFPLLLGTVVGLWFGYAAIPAVVLGSLLASHTLLGMLIVKELGASRLEPVTVTAGATVMSDTLSLVVFAVCLSSYQRGFSMSVLATQLVEIVAVVLLVLFGLAACGAPDQGTTPRVTEVVVLVSPATIAEPSISIPTAIELKEPVATTAPAPTRRKEETAMPDQTTPKPADEQPTAPPTPTRPTLQLGATLVPEGAAPIATPIGTASASATAPTAQVEIAKADLARRRAVAPDTIRIVEVRDVVWPDRGLGCPQPGMAYNQVQVDGLLIRLESGGQVFEYHSGGSKAPFLCEQPSGGDKATPVRGGEGQ